MPVSSEAFLSLVRFDLVLLSLLSARHLCHPLVRLSWLYILRLLSRINKFDELS